MTDYAVFTLPLDVPADASAEEKLRAACELADRLEIDVPVLTVRVEEEAQTCQH